MYYGIRMVGAVLVPTLDAWEWWRLPSAVREKIRALQAIGANVKSVSLRPGAIVHLVRLDDREMLLHGAMLYGAMRQGRYPMGANQEIHGASIRIVDGQPLYWARDAHGWYPTHGYETRTFRFAQIAVRGSDKDGRIIVWARDVVGWHLCLGMKRVEGPYPQAPYGQRVEQGKVVPLFAEEDIVPTGAPVDAVN